jgi:hypothetical protein
MSFSFGIIGILIICGGIAVVASAAVLIYLFVSQRDK